MALPMRRGGSRWRYGIMMLFFIVALCVPIWLYWGFIRVDGLVEGRIVAAQAPFAGMVKTVQVSAGEKITQGDVLLLLDDTLLQASLEEARAWLRGIGAGGGTLLPGFLRSEEQVLQAGIDRAREAESLARQAVEHSATVHVQRLLALRALDADVRRPPSGDARNAARLAEIEARAGLEKSRTALQMASRQRAAIEAQFVQFRNSMFNLARMSVTQLTDLQNRQAAWVHELEKAVQAATVTAPISGKIVRLDASAGMMAAQGQALVSIMPTTPSNVQIVARLTSSQAARVVNGMGVSVSINEASPPVTLAGTVDSLQQVPMQQDAIVYVQLEPDNTVYLEPGMRAKLSIALF